ncbi:putative sterigmatocystin 8-O-methyltransferase precursor [Hypoxylon sp. FL0543]|nr:putative sterigmatocystin 8-O-methyltransferase precursor [Hypoxylon sp. FL0543]
MVFYLPLIPTVFLDTQSESLYLKMAFNPNEAQAFLEKIQGIIAQPEQIFELHDDSLRRKLREAGWMLSLAMEAPGDTVHRISNTPLQLALARIGVEKRVFEILAGGDGHIFTNAELAHQSGIDPVLMKRLLRYYQSYGMISQPGNDAYSRNNVTTALASDGGRSGISYFFEMISPSFMAFPRFLRQNGYVNPTDPNHCPWHLGHDTDLSPFPWLQSHPEHLGYFLPWMTAQRDGLPIFLDVLDFEREFARNTTPSTPLFVDIGGAIGHQCVALKRRFPELPGRIILQEQAHVISQVKENPLPGFEGIEAQSYDFFTPQPIKGARTYYLRNILHDWPDHKCKEILQNIKAAMTGDSVLLIDEMVLSERGAPWRATQLDIAMITCLAATERTEADWQALLNNSGFKIKKIWKYTDECEDCVLVAIPK